MDARHDQAESRGVDGIPDAPMHAEAVVRFTDDSADTRNLELQEGCVTQSAERTRMPWGEAFGYLITHALKNPSVVQMVEPNNNPNYLHELSEAIYSAVDRVRAQEELIAELELDKKRLDVLGELAAEGRIRTSRDDDGMSDVWIADEEDRHRHIGYATLREAADAEIAARSLLTADAGEKR
jgi:hypothetical protein